MDFDQFIWTDHEKNPLISPRFPDWLLGDPTVLLPDETTDGRWHLFANSIPRIHHYTSDDGISWKHRRVVVVGGVRPFLRKFDGAYFLFYEKTRSPIRSEIVMRQSEDLKKWSAEQSMLKPCLNWHGRKVKTCGNPCVVEKDGTYLMYYSAHVVLLRDCGFFEPRHIGIARADHIAGPYEPDPEPMLSPDPAHPHRNHGAGAIKVIHDGQRSLFWGFNNGIYLDSRRRSRSAILLLKSTDGERWEQVHGEPIIAPGKIPWKRALVYALDVRAIGDNQAYLYYNARDGWLIGFERIGLCVGRNAVKGGSVVQGSRFRG